MKRIFALFICAAMCLGLLAAAAENESFTVLQLPYTESDGFNIRARFADTKQPIPLSDCYDGTVFATVPAEYAGREIELFEPEAIEFSDAVSSYEFSVMRELSAYGIVQGNASGEARPFDPVTRAEATAMIVRLLGLDSAQYEMSFEDVSENDWFYSAVAVANRAGIVRGNSERNFAPNRHVSREEVMVMAARALEYAALGKLSADALSAADLDAVSQWAIEAYRAFGLHAIFDHLEEPTETPILVYRPQSAATRGEVAKLIYNIIRFGQVYPSQVAMEFGFDEEMPTIDGSTSTYPFTQSVYGALFSNGNAHSQHPKQHSKSHASYERLINGEVDLLFASVYPSSDILTLAKEKGVELELIPIANDAMIFFTNADNPATGLTKEQISNIYVHNAYSNWLEVGGPDALLYPYCRNDDSGSHAQMERHFLNGNAIHETIRRETTSVSMSNVLTDVMEAETKDPRGFGLGYSIYYYFHNMDMFYDTTTELKLLAIDGVYPNDETIANATYPLSNNTYVVLRADTPKDAPARKMAEFMLTEAGQRCVEAAGFGKLTKD